MEEGDDSGDGRSPLVQRNSSGDTGDVDNDSSSAAQEEESTPAMVAAVSASPMGSSCTSRNHNPCNAAAGTDNPPTSEQNTKATIEDICRVAIINQYAGAKRFLGSSIADQKVQDQLEATNAAKGTKDKNDPTKPRTVPKYVKTDDVRVNPTEPASDDSDFLKSGDFAVPLHGVDAKFLNQGSCRNATPMSMNETDQNAVFEMEEMERRGHIRNFGETISLEKFNDKESWVQLMYETIFSIALFRCTGRTDPFRHFGRRKGIRNYIPLPEQLEDFYDCLEADMRNKGGNHSIFAKWISNQHRGSLASEWTKWTNFKTLGVRLRDELKAILEAFFDESTKEDGNFVGGRFTNHFTPMVEKMENLLSACCDKSPDLRWLAQSIIGDLYNFFEDPFGKIEGKDMRPGYGSKKTLTFLENNGLYKPKKKKAKYESFGRALDAIVRNVNKEIPDTCLDTVNLYRDEQSKVRLKINGVLFNARHAEHWMCKYYVQVKFTWSSYRKILQPQPAAPHCWPRKWRLADCQDVTSCLRELKEELSKTVEKFTAIMDGDDENAKKYLTYPDMLILLGEKIPGYPVHDNS